MKYVYSGSPQIRDNATTKRIMIDVCIALLPACILGCIFFGLGALLILLIATLSAVAGEVVFRLCQKASFKQIVDEFDFTSVVTGMLIGMNMYSNSKWYTAIFASVFAIVVVKMLFGGTGKNIVNPAIAGRIFAFIAFGVAFGGTYAGEKNYLSQLSAQSCYTEVNGVRVGATPLQALFNENVVNNLTNLDMFLGTGVYGCIGEVSKAALLVGAIYLIARGVLDFKWPLIYILTTGVVAVIVEFISLGKGLTLAGMFATKVEPALEVFLPSILSGGLFLGAIFMATDYVTTPVTNSGKYLYFVLLGVLTAVLRKATGLEVVSFVILLGNLIVPLIDMYLVRRPFGYQKPAKKEAK